MKQSILKEVEVKFGVGHKPVRFLIYHDLPETFGLSIENAIDNWLFRTNEYTAKSLCGYIKNKETGCECMTEAQYKKRMKLP